MLRLLVLLLFPATILAADPPKIELPKVVPPKVVVQPVVPPPTDLVASLNTGEWYLFDHPTELLPQAVPAGIVQFETRKPGWFNGKFAGSTKVDEEREYKGPFVYRVKAVGVGQVTILWIPVGATKADDVTTIILMVNGAQPPPIVVPPVDPPVVPPVVIPASDFRVLFAWQPKAALTMNQVNVINSTKIREYLNRKCPKESDGTPGWKAWSTDVLTNQSPEVWKGIWRDTQPKLTDPANLVILNGTKGKVFTLAADADEDSTLKLLQQYGGP